MKSLLVLGISALLIPVAGFAQKKAPEPFLGLGKGPLAPPPVPMAQGLDCYENLNVPAFPQSALKAHVDGTVWTVADVGPDGKIEKLDTNVVSAWSSGAKMLTPPVEKVIREAKIKPSCDGMKVAMVFRYQLYGEPTANPKPESSTEKPDIMYIQSQPEPMVHH